ncbi:hypothetical protein [Methanobrevibacter sp.]|uniref:hypothetical protein n=1 Tax=Methanobrevibacter sp. TaxID=66852 RepID=UPI0025ED5F36|nr:hypothetical protein [Methanobrevibacter sp.]MBQ2832416.1 hypothetical protein [Methanobrevibacter sp.]
MREPARLGKVETKNTSINVDWIFLHPSAVILGIGFTLFLIGILVFALTGHAAVDSGGMRNFIASGV